VSSFLSSLFGGSNSTLSGDINQTGSLAGYGSNLGQQNTNAGSGFFSSLLSGNSAQIAQTLAPEISQMQQGGQQQKNAIAQFGNRSGGSNSAAQGIDSGNRANLTNLIGGLQSGAASSLLSSGQNLLNTSLGALGQQADMSEIQQQNWANSIFGQGLTGGLLGGEGIGLASGAKAAGVAGLFG
jgi:hypothetical protein